MKQHEVISKASTKSRKRRGRGYGSGLGTYSGKGLKGQNSRSGGGVSIYFQGGQLPLTKSLPKLRGFNNKFRIEYTILNINSISHLPSDTLIDSTYLIDNGIIANAKNPIKILGAGDIDHPIKVKAHKFSTSAKSKIISAGGSAQEI
jgi:large subunit ribosomal protein L15|tara:strand:+ start:272 stop:712 length:441 start_codon:yes stop_codon:yes gene_type:complete